MKIRKEFVMRDVLGTHMVFVTGREMRNKQICIKLNESSAIMWEMLVVGCEENDLVEALCKKYKADRKIVQNDVERFIEKLKENDCIE